MEKFFIVFLIGMMLCGCSTKATKVTKKTYDNAHTIILNGTSATIDGKAIEEYDYTWHIDNTVAHDEVSNSPAEYHTGTKSEGTIYIDHDLVYYPKQDESNFKLVNYDGEQEYVSYYKDGENDEYIFSTLPSYKTFPSTMMHSEEEASQNAVLHIKETGTYVLEGSFKGQINISLDDEEAFTNEQAKVTIILNGVDIECSVAPAIIFNNLYECDNEWESNKSTNTVDTSGAGANIIIADETSNSVKGNNIYRILKTKYKDEESKEDIKAQKKAYKIDSPLYSFVSLNINGEEKGNGELLIESSFEGMGTELHLTINGGNIFINSQDDGINVNEDNVSVLTINDGSLTLNAGLGQEGDGIDSNGFVTINGGILNINDIEAPDNYIDSEDGILCNGGEIYIDNELYDMQIGQVVKEIGNERGARGRSFDNAPFGNQDFDIKEFKQKVAELDDTATIQDVMELLDNRMNIPGEDFNPEQMGEPPVNMGERPNDRGFTPPDKK